MYKFILIIAAAGLIGAAGSALADPAPDTKPKQSCFLSTQFENWKAPDAKTIYVRAGFKRYFRLDLANECHALKWPNAMLITQIHGSNMICGPLDWDLHVTESWHDIPEGCIVKSMTELTPDEAAAIPKPFKP